MADNVPVTPGTGLTIRADEVGSALLQVIKIGLGADGAEDLLLDSGQQVMANSLPVVLASDQSSVFIEGPVDHDGLATGVYPVAVGGYATNAEAPAVAHNDISRIRTDLVGKLLTLPYSIPETMVSGVTAVITGTARTELIAAQASGIRTYLTNILVTNAQATVGTFVAIEDNTTTVYVGYAAPAGGGFSVSLPVPLRGSANTAWNVSCLTAGAIVRVSASGYKGV